MRPANKAEGRSVFYICLGEACAFEKRGEDFGMQDLSGVAGEGDAAAIWIARLPRR
jgi:hypothetical protein